MKKFCRLLLATAILVSASAPAFAESDKTYTFSVVPQQSAKRLAQIWSPILEHLSQQTGLKFRFATAKNIPAFEKRLAEGKYDFAYMNPYHFTVFNQSPGYTAVVKRKEQPIRGIVVVRKDSELSSLGELEGKKMVFPSPAAFAASVLPRAQLLNDGISVKPKYVSSHDSVYLNVAKGLFPAGGGVKRTFNNIPEETRKQLKILWTTNPYTPHAIAAHPDIKSETKAALQQALKDLETTPEGIKLLRSLKVKHGFVVAGDDDWDDVRELGIELLSTLIKG